MSSFLDARCQGKGEGGGDGFWSRHPGIGHPPLPCPVADLNLQIFPVKSANEHPHIFCEGSADEQKPHQLNKANS